MVHQPMTEEQEMPQHATLSQAFAKYLFEDLPDGENLPGLVRWLVATAGTVTFFIFSMSVYSQDTLRPFESEFGSLFTMGLIYCMVLGYLVSWKRYRSGPVNLYVSGVALPSFVVFAARSTEIFSSGTP